jgi:outer membrane protein, heavy metal efflux system
MRREASAMLDASHADLLNVRNETVARIIETRARAEEDRNLVRLYRSSIVPQARAAVQTSLASYRVGQLSFMQLIDNQLTVKNYQTETFRLLADYQEALGDLSALVGGPVTEDSP